MYVTAAAGDGGRHQISIDSGGEPVWSPDGRTLYYRAGGKWMAADISTSPASTVSRRRALFADVIRGTSTYANYDISRDGRSFPAVSIGTGNEAAQRIVVVTGWLDELKARLAQAAAK